MAIKTTRYGVGDEINQPIVPPLEQGKTFSFPYKATDNQNSMSTEAGVHLLIIEGGRLLFTNDSGTWEPTFGATEITITWYHREKRLDYKDEAVFIFNAFTKQSEGMSHYRYVATGGQTTFSGADADGNTLEYSVADAVQVFQNGSYVPQTDYTATSLTSIVLDTGASASDTITVWALQTLVDQTELVSAINSTSASATSATTSATNASNDADDAEKWANHTFNTLFTLSDGVTTGYSAKSRSVDAERFAEFTIGQTFAATGDNTSTHYSAKHYANDAANSASSASNSATSTTNNAAAAAASATAAQNALDSFEAVYLGASATDPTTDANGDALTAGDQYFNTTSNNLYVYTGSAWQIAGNPTNLAGLNDVDNSMSPSSGQVLQYDGSDWDAATLNLTTTLASLTDTNLTSIQDDQVLQYDNASSQWKNETLNLTTTLASLTDTNISGIQDDHILRYDSASGEWKNEIPGYLTSSNPLASLSDVAMYTASSGDVLAWDGSQWDATSGYLTSISGQSIEDLNDVASMTPGVNDLLYWTGTQWSNSANPGSFLTSISGSSIKDLSDVNSSMSPSTNNLLKWSGSEWTADSSTYLTSSSSIEDLTDVGSFSPSTGDLLKWNGSEWNIGNTSLAELTDTNISSPQANQFIRYDNANSKWKNEDVTIPSSMTDLSDVSNSMSANSGDVLTYSGSEWNSSGDFLTGNDSIENLNDVAAMTPNTGDFLYYNGSQWTNSSTVLTTSDNLDDLNNVQSSMGPSTGDFLYYDGAQWTKNSNVLTTSNNLDDLSNVQSSMSPSTGDHLYWDGSTWTKSTTTLTTTSSLDQLSNVTASSPNNGEVLQYDGSNWISANTTATLATLTDTTISSVQDDQILRYNNANSKWENENLSLRLDELTQGTSDTILQTSSGYLRVKGYTYTELEATEDIIFDHGGSYYTKFQEGGAEYLTVRLDTDVQLKAVQQNSDIKFMGMDDSNEITALTLDMSEEGKALFNHHVVADGNGSSGGVTLRDGAVEVRTGTGNVAALDFYCEVSNAHKVTVKAPPHANFTGDVNFQLPSSEGTTGQVLQTDGSGNTSWTTAGGGASAIDGLSDAKSGGTGFGSSLKLGDSGTGTLNNAYYNVFVGIDSGTGITEGDHNTAVGYSSLNYVTTGYENTSLGSYSGGNILGGYCNVTVGYYAGYNLIGGYENILIGKNAGKDIQTGYDNTIIGNYSGSSSLTGEVWIGAAGSERIKVNSSGEMTVNASFTLPSGDGSANQVLQTNGSGTVSWANAGGGGGAITALNNATENELVTVGATTTELDAESALTWDGTTLNIGTGGFGNIYCTNHIEAVGDLKGNDLQMTGTATGNTVGPHLNILRDSSSPADWDKLGIIRFKGNNSASSSGASTTYNFIHSTAVDITNGSEESSLDIGGHAQGYADQTLYRLMSTKLQMDGRYVNDIEWSFSQGTGYTTKITTATPTAARTWTLPDATGTVLTTGNSDTPTTTTASGDADYVLVDDGGTMKKITPANLGIGGGGGGGASDLDDLSDVKKGGTDFTDSMMIGATSTGTLSSASDNLFIATSGAGDALTSGTSNIGIGNFSLSSVQDGASNIGVGYSAGHSNNASFGIFIGHQAAQYLTGASPTIIGYHAARGVSGQTTAAYTTAIGFEAGYSVTTAQFGVHIGHRAGKMVTGGGYSVNIGAFAGNDTSTGDSNTNIGYEAGRHGNNIGNVYIGRLSGHGVSSVTGANYNVGVGYNTLTAITSGDGNTCIGKDAGDSITSADNNTIIGVGMDPDSATAGGEIVIGTEHRRIHVDNTGAVQFNSAFRFPAADGSANQVLETDGSGTLSWATVSGGGGSSTLNGLTDVTISTPSNGQVLKYDGSGWVNGTDADSGGGGGGITTGKAIAMAMVFG